VNCVEVERWSWVKGQLHCLKWRESGRWETLGNCGEQGGKKQVPMRRGECGKGREHYFFWEMISLN